MALCSVSPWLTGHAYKKYGPKYECKYSPCCKMINFSASPLQIQTTCNVNKQADCLQIRNSCTQ